MDSAAASAHPLPLRDLLSLTKPGVTSLNLVATAGGYLLAPGHASAGRLLWATVGTALVVGAANTLNCYLERDVDRLMTRTRIRPLPSGRLQPHVALSFGLLLSAAGVALLSLAVHPLAGLLSALALVAYVMVYTPMKQRSSLALLVGAVPGAAPPLIGWAAATGGLGLPGVLLFLFLFLWQVPHFLAIALYRKEEYGRAGLKVLPLETGDAPARAELMRYLLAMVATSLMLVPTGAAGGVYLVAAVALGAWAIGRGALGLRKDAGTRWARSFFMTTNVYLMLMMGALAIDHLV
jgi:heme o synthase